MRKPCSHIKKCSITAAVNHNTRVTKCAQHREDLRNLNEQFRYIEHSLKKEESIIRKLVKEKTKRKLQCNAIPIKEDVLVCKPDTTLDEVKEYCRRVNEMTGMIPLVIDLHRDEGHYEDGEWMPNVHAHVMWRMYNSEGRNVRLQRDGCRKMQDSAASALGMERGTPKRDKRHVDAADYRLQQQEKRIAELESRIQAKSETAEHLKGAYDGAKQGISDIFTGKARKSKEEAEKRAKEAEMREKEAALKAEEKIDRINAEADARVQEERRKASEAVAEKDRFIDKYSKQIERIDSIEEKNKRLSTDNAIKNAQLDNLGQQLKEISGLINAAAEQKLSADQIQQLIDKKEIDAPERLYFQGETVAVPAGSRLSFVKELLIQLPNSKPWKSLKSWLESTFRRKRTAKAEKGQAQGIKIN